METALDRAWDFEEFHRKPIKGLLKEYLSRMEFPCHVRDIVSLGSVGTPDLLEVGEYFAHDGLDFQPFSVKFPLNFYWLHTFWEFFPEEADRLTDENFHQSAYLLSQKLGPVVPVYGEDYQPLGYIPAHQNYRLGMIYITIYRNLLMLNVKSKESNAKTILIRKTAKRQFEDTKLNIPMRYFLKDTVYHFYDETEKTSYIASIKRGELQIMKVFFENKDGRRGQYTVLNIPILELCNDEGNLTKKSIRQGLENKVKLYFDNDSQNSYEIMANAFDEEYDLGLMIESPHIPAIATLTFPLNKGTNSMMEIIVGDAKSQETWKENWTKDCAFIINLLGFISSPPQRKNIMRMTKEYCRQNRYGNETKFKVWGYNHEPIKASKKLGNTNRYHHVSGHMRNQPIKHIEKYESQGYVVQDPHENPFVEIFIESHWRGNSNQGTLETILIFGKQPSGYSQKAISWLNRISAKEGINIEHAQNGGERVFVLSEGKIAKVDGFCEETDTIYEFYGDYYHGNPRKYAAEEYNKTMKKTMGELYEKTIRRENALKEMGFNVISVWEMDYDETVR